jgi:hypothetical protein
MYKRPQVVKGYRREIPGPIGLKVGFAYMDGGSQATGHYSGKPDDGTARAVRRAVRAETAGPARRRILPAASVGESAQAAY